MPQVRRDRASGSVSSSRRMAALEVHFEGSGAVLPCWSGHSFVPRGSKFACVRAGVDPGEGIGGETDGSPVAGTQGAEQGAST